MSFKGLRCLRGCKYFPLLCHALSLGCEAKSANPFLFFEVCLHIYALKARPYFQMLREPPTSPPDCFLIPVLTQTVLRPLVMTRQTTEQRMTVAHAQTGCELPSRKFLPASVTTSSTQSFNPAAEDPQHHQSGVCSHTAGGSTGHSVTGKVQGCERCKHRARQSHPSWECLYLLSRQIKSSICKKPYFSVIKLRNMNLGNS